MSFTLKFIACVVTGLGITATSFAQTTLYVAPNGNDAQPGTEQEPFITLERARDAVRKIKADGVPDDGIVVVLRGGTYRLNKTFVLGSEDSGMPDKPVIWKAYQDEKPILSGGIPVTGWTADSNGRFKATVNLDNFRQLWVNGKRATRARGAVPDGLKAWGKHEAKVKPENQPQPTGTTGTPGYTAGTLVDIAPAGYTTSNAQLADWRNPGDIEFGYYNKWTHMIAKVEKVTKSPEGAIIEMAQPGFFLCHRKGGTQAGMPAYMENALELLDKPGEWYFDRPAHTLYYMPLPGGDMVKAEVIVPSLEMLVELKGTLDKPIHDLRFEGLTFAHATWLLPSTNYGHPDGQANFTQPIDNGYFRPESDHGWISVNIMMLKSPANIVVDAGRNIRFEGCTFTALGGAGLDLQNGAQDNVVSGCLFYDISGSGIQVGDSTPEDHHPSDPRRIVKDNQVTNNVITRIGVEYTDAIGVFYGYTDGTVIAHNEIFNIPYSGVSGGWGWGMADAGGAVYVSLVTYQTPTVCRNNRIEFNHIHDLMRARIDGAGVYTLGRQPGTIIRGNHIHDAGPGAPGGVYLDEGSADIEVTENVIYRVKAPLFFNNRNQNRIATCPVHDNYTNGAPPTADGANKITNQAGLESKYQGLRKRVTP